MLITFKRIFAYLLLNEVCLSHISQEFPTIETYGNKFFYSDTDNQFFIKGIAYQPKAQGFTELATLVNIRDSLEEDYITENNTKYIDPLGNPNICLRDIPYFERLGINTIRVYAIDPQQKHDICMNALMNSGIYVILDLSEPNISINRDNPTWDITIWNRYKAVIDSMHTYKNILGFFAGNEVTNDLSNTEASTFVKAAIRDTKNYIREKEYRNIPVGYSTNDDINTRKSLAKFFICGDIKVDFYGINMYEWCGYSSFEISGYKERTQEFKNYPVPIFFSEFGCNLIRPRPFTEINALFGPQMVNVWSGGIVYMYFEEENKYGVVQLSEDDQSIHELDDFETLSTAFNKVSLQILQKKNYTKELGNKNNFSINCPSLSPFWKANEKLPPTPNEEICSCIDTTLPCIVVPSKEAVNYESIFEYLCGEVDCTDIKSDGSLGYYGEFSGCSTEQKLSLEISKLFLQRNENTNICPFDSEGITFKTVPRKRKTFKINKEDDICSSVFNKINVNKEKISGDSHSEKTTTTHSKGNILKFSSKLTRLIYKLYILALFI